MQFVSFSCTLVWEGRGELLSIILCSQIHNRCLSKSLVMKKNLWIWQWQGPINFKKIFPSFCYLSMPAFQCLCTLLKSTAVISCSYYHPSLDVSLAAHVTWHRRRVCFPSRPLSSCRERTMPKTSASAKHFPILTNWEKRSRCKQGWISGQGGLTEKQILRDVVSVPWSFEGKIYFN